MSAHNIPVYKDTMRLVNMLLDHIQDMPVKHRRTLGDRILDTGYQLLATLNFAYGATKSDRVGYLTKFQAEFNTLQTYLRIANERRFIHLNHAVNIAELAAKISKQIGGWGKSLNSEREV